MIAAIVRLGSISQFAYSCEGRWWAIECWFLSVKHVLDWASFVALAVCALYACYRVCERIGDLAQG